MQRCPSCGVSVAGHKTCCPLCGGELEGTPEPQTEVFPPLVRPRMTEHFVLRLIGLVVLAGSAVSVLINMALGTAVWWSIFVVLGGVCVWIAAAVGIAYRREVLVNIGWQVALISGISVLWDWGMGWRGWSIDFVLPSVVVAGMVTILLLALLLHLPLYAFAGAFLFTCMLGLLPWLLVAMGKVHYRLPSLLCAGLSIVALATMLVFRWSTIKSELHRRFHL